MTSAHPIAALVAAVAEAFEASTSSCRILPRCTITLAEASKLAQSIPLVAAVAEAHPAAKTTGHRPDNGDGKRGPWPTEILQGERCGGRYNRTSSGSEEFIGESGLSEV